MKAFFVGLLFLICIGVFSLGIVLLIPLLAVLNIFLYILFFIAISVLIVWLLGKVVLWGWGEFKK